MHVEMLLSILASAVGDAWVAEHEKSGEGKGCPDDRTTEVLEIEIVDSGLSEISRVFHVETEPIVQAGRKGAEYCES